MPKRLFRGIKVKMTAAIIAAVLGTALALTAITYFLVSYTFRHSLDVRAAETSKILSEALRGRSRQLAIRAEIIAGDNDFQTSYAFRQDELARLTKDLADRAGKIGASAALVADLEGHPVTTYEPRQDPGGAELAKSVAFHEVQNTAAATTTVENLGGQVCIVAATPLKRYDVQTLGYVVLAQVLDKPLLKQLKEAASAEVLLVRDGQVRAATAPLDRGQEIIRALPSSAPGEPVRAVQGLATAGGNQLLAWAMPLFAGGQRQATLIFGFSARDAKALQQKVLRASLGLALVIMVGSGLLGLMIATRISDPIVEIEHSFREIAASGDLSRRITKPYGDEVGRMAESFNAMQGQIEQLHGRVAAAEQRMRDELKMAAAVQEMLFPTTVIDGVRCQIVTHAQTSTETGGDWLTIIHAPEQGITTCIVSDVTGHGAPAALVTAILHGFLKATEGEISLLRDAGWQPGMEAILRRLNRTVIESTRRSLVCSLFCLTFNHETLQASYVNAGHLAPLLLRRHLGKPAVSVITTAPSTLIGAGDEPQFAWGELQLQSDDLFLLYTDGLVECTNEDREPYGFRRLRKLLLAAADRDARGLRDALVADATAFYGAAPPEDDITVIVGKVR